MWLRNHLFRDAAEHYTALELFYEKLTGDLSIHLPLWMPGTQTLHQATTNGHALMAEASQVGSKPQSMESRITQALAAVDPPKLRSALEWMEHLALLKRWHYRSSKVGELFLTESGELPMRRVVRGVSRVFRGEKAAPDLSETAGDYWQFRAREAGIPDK